MNRKNLLKKAALAFATINSISLFDVFASDTHLPKAQPSSPRLPIFDARLQDEFKKIVAWLKENKWEAFLLQHTRQSNINWDDMQSLRTVLPIIDRSANNGFDDFGGNKLIEPGNPSLSLLYHALASPRVQDDTLLAYPSIEQLDVVENVIYGLKKVEEYVTNPNDDNLHLMVLAYEYRPAYKTPALGINPFETTFPKHAQMVFSRAGISRIGNHALQYDAKKRSYTNKPLQEKFEKEIAVTPARFGVFLVELVEIEKSTRDSIKVMNIQEKEFTTVKGCSEQLNRHFIKPLRKIYDDEVFRITYAQYHLNQKLYKFSQFKLHGKKIDEVNHAAKWDVCTYPFKRADSFDDAGKQLSKHANDNPLVQLIRKESSVLLSSIPRELVRIAEQQSKQLSFYVEPRWKRRYNALKLSNKENTDIYDSLFTEFFFRRNRVTSRFRAMRNAPLFVNIKYQVTDKGVSHLDEHTENVETVITNGGYCALLFEDSMCDGCVSATVTPDETKVKNLPAFFQRKPIVHNAFSIVAAPDFFPYIDSNDIRKYYHANAEKYAALKDRKVFTDQEQQTQQRQMDDLATGNDEHFLEGGSINLSGIRQRGNCDILDPFTGAKAFSDSFAQDKSFDTLVAVTSPVDTLPDSSFTRKGFYNNFQRDYSANSFLPDTGTGIFFPGWDVTYSGKKRNPYFATFGLGSPFPEDMKLCAAANGMWPVASPDAGRTFHGSLQPFPILGRPNTSILLLDDELGLHPNAPHVQEHKLDFMYGWDGEHGPYLTIDKKDNQLKVNFTDIGRADYIANIRDKTIGFDMSKLRELSVSEVINRMDCLRKAIKEIDDEEVSETKYWLISAEQVADWAVGAHAYGISNTLIGISNAWAQQSRGLRGKGYLFVFAKTKIGELEDELETPTSKRRQQVVKKLCVCKVSVAKKDSYTKIDWCELTPPLPTSASNIIWKPAIANDMM